MHTFCPSSLAAALLAVAAAPLAAQNFQSVPAHADAVDGHQSTGLPFGVPGFRTQLLIDAAAIAPTGAALTGMRLRADRPSSPQAAVSVPNVTVTLSQSTTFVGNMNQDFAANVTGPTTIVFQGTVDLPAQPVGHAGPLPWDIVIPFAQPYVLATAQGNLLVDIVGNNPVGGFPQFYLDAVQPGGSAVTFGQGGDNPSFDTMNLIVSTGPSMEPRLLSPGHSVDVTTTMSFSQPLGVLMLGQVGLPVPLDLTGIGAPTNSLYLLPEQYYLLSWQQSFIGWYAPVTFALPNDPQLVGAIAYAQTAIFEPLANQFGFVFSHAVEIRVGSQGGPLPMQQLDSDDPLSPTGTLLDFGWGPSEFGAVPVQFEGAFF